MEDLLPTERAPQSREREAREMPLARSRLKVILAKSK
jgi:hypothetical protein